MHPELVFEQAQARMAELLRDAELDRQVRAAGRSKPVAIDVARYWERFVRRSGARGSAPSPAGAL